jgi:ABC-type proline/glycine betaine transport system permease subunit
VTVVEVVVDVALVGFVSPVLSALSVPAVFAVSLSLSPGPLVRAMTGVTTSPKASKDAANPRIPSSLN